DDPALQAMWQPWASEIAADVYAFVLTGYAAVAALYDVVADDRSILRWPLGDPHPIGWLRTLLGCAMCRQAYGAGPWDRLEQAPWDGRSQAPRYCLNQRMLATCPTPPAEASPAALLERSRRRMAQIAELCLELPVPGFRNRPIVSVVDPQRVSPNSLGE